MFRHIFEKLDIPIKNPEFDFIYKPPKQRKISQYMYTKRGYCQADLLFFKTFSSSEGETNQGLQYLLVMVDMMKPYKVDVEVLRNKTAESIKKGFEKIFARDIIKKDDVKVIYTDEGSEFINPVVKSYMDTNQISLRSTVAGRKRQNAIVEMVNGLLRQLLMGYNEYKNLTREPNNRRRYINSWKEKLRQFITELNKYFEETQEKISFDEMLKSFSITKHEMKNILRIDTKVYVPYQKPPNEINPNNSHAMRFKRGVRRYKPEKYKIAEILFNPKWKQPRYIVIPENEDLQNYAKKYNKVTYQRSELLKA